MSDIQMQISKEALVMQAWEQYKATEEFANSRKWALVDEHTNGSMWAAFYAGFFACAVNAGSEAAEAAAEITRLRAEAKANLDLAERHMNEKHALRARNEELVAWVNKALPLLPLSFASTGRPGAADERNKALDEVRSDARTLLAKEGKP